MWLDLRWCESPRRQISVARSLLLLLLLPPPLLPLLLLPLLLISTELLALLQRVPEIDSLEVAQTLALLEHIILTPRRIDLGLPLDEQAVGLSVKRAKQLVDGGLERRDARAASRLRLLDRRCLQVLHQPAQLASNHAANEQ